MDVGEDVAGGSNVGRLDELGSYSGRELVERALARAIRVDRPGERHDPDHVRPCSRGRLEAVAADGVEADPDRAHSRRAMVSSRP